MEKKIRITLKSFNHELLNQSCQQLIEIIKKEQFVTKVAGPISLPTKKKSYCVLRSPHVNKDSREQFEIRRYKKIIEIHSISEKILVILINSEVSPAVATKLFIHQ